MDAPIIGITTSFVSRTDAKITLDFGYVSAVERAGGVPVIIPMLSSLSAMQRAMTKVDGLIIPGGPGITDRIVGELPEDLPPVSLERAQTDNYAYKCARQDELPILGICYGMQFVNARFGGSIYGDVEREIGVGPHHPKRTDQDTLSHDVTIESGSRLRDVIQHVSPVNSFHIQAVANVGKGLRVSIRSQDGLVEGIESEDGRIVGVQFHPEKMPDTGWDALFTDLVQRCAS